MEGTDEGFYGTGSVKEMVGWKLTRYFREIKDDEIDTLYGGFSFMTVEKDGQVILAFRGTAGDMVKSPLAGRGDWYHDFFSYPFSTDPGGALSESAMEGTLKLNPNMHKLYMTGHSRAGMLSQRAASKLVEENNDYLLQRLVYFNGLGAVMNTSKFNDKVDGELGLNNIPILPTDLSLSQLDQEDLEIMLNLYSIRDKISAYRVINNFNNLDDAFKFPYDLVSMLGLHLVFPKQIVLISLAEENSNDIISALHSMSNFTYYLKREKTLNEI